MGIGPYGGCDDSFTAESGIETGIIFAFDRKIRENLANNPCKKVAEVLKL